MTTITTQFRLAPDDTAQQIAESLGRVGEVVCKPAERQQSVYYDTFDWRLYACGKYIVVRPGPLGSEVHFCDARDRNAITITPGDLPTGFAEDFPPGLIRDLVREIIDVRRLLPCLTVTSDHTPITIRNREAKTVLRLAVDDMQARQPDGGEPVDLGRYLAMTPVRGYRKAESRARKILGDHFTAHRTDAPIHIAGLVAVGTIPGNYTSKLKLKLDPRMSAGDAVRHIHLALLDTMERNEAGTAENIDPEFLHDFRVAIRRTRSALAQIDRDVLPPAIIAKAQKDFRWIGQQTNTMRDLDVYLIDFPGLQAALPEAYRAHLQPFQEYLCNESRAETKKVAAMVRGKRYRGIRDRWRALLDEGFDALAPEKHTETGVKALADARIWKFYRRVIRESSAIDDSSPAEALHDLRITCKKLRYLLEFFQSLYPQDDIKKLIKSLRNFQNVLGTFQDTEIQSLAILRFGREMTAARAAPVETQMAMGMVAESILLRQGVARQAFQEQFEKFSRPDVRALFAELFKNRG